MDELDLLRKKTGMTIAKAWMLMIITVIIFFCLRFIFQFLNNQSISPVSFSSNQSRYIAMGLAMSIGCTIGYFINKKERLSFKKVSIFSILCCLLISWAWCYTSPIIYDIMPLNIPKPPKIQGLEPRFFITTFALVLMVLLQIGIIGHGLLKNYPFKDVIFTVAAVSVIMITPQVVMSLVFEILFLFPIYYRTASLILPLFVVATVNITEETIMIITDADFSTNYVRTYFFQDTLTYSIGFIISLLVIIGGVFYIKKYSKPIQWLKPEEDETIMIM
jgi:hypothetical protein